MKYWRDHASYPFRSHELWFLTEDIPLGVLPPETDMRALIGQVNREDIWRDCRRRSPCRRPTSRVGTSRGRETSSTARSSIPTIRQAYLASLAIKKLAA